MTPIKPTSSLVRQDAGFARTPVLHVRDPTITTFTVKVCQAASLPKPACFRGAKRQAVSPRDRRTLGSRPFVCSRNVRHPPRWRARRLSRQRGEPQSMCRQTATGAGGAGGLQRRRHISGNRLLRGVGGETLEGGQEGFIPRTVCLL